MQKYSTKYRDSVFCMLFNNPGKLRGLYNALTGFSYGEDTPVVINTLTKDISLGLHNDISFTLGGKTIVLIEHASTISPNMPVRLLLYMAKIYEKLIPRRELYARKKIKIPRPEFYMFYNGSEPFPDETTLSLSELFEEVPEAAKPWIELEVKAYNINLRHGKELLEKNRDLGEYARFVDVVRGKKVMGGDPEEMYSLAIDECIGNNILREFLDKYRREVMSSLLSISREEYIEIRMEEAREEGHEKGREEATRETAGKLKAIGMPLTQIADVTGLSAEELENL